MSDEPGRTMSAQERLRFMTSLLDAVEQAVIATDAGGRILYWNRFAEGLYGWRADEVEGRAITDVLLKPAIRDKGRKAIAALSQGNARRATEWELTHRDGRPLVVRVTSSLIHDGRGRIEAIVGVSWDISREKSLAEELHDRGIQLRALSQRLLAAQEAERRAIARELHDDFGQMLTVIRLNLEALRRDCAGESARRLTESVRLVDQAIAQMRNLALELRPAILDDLGLVAALRWLLKRHLGRAGVEVRLSVGSSETRFPTPVETCSFRLVQEALTNIARHSEATQVDVGLTVADGELHVVVRDDGRGFDVGAALQRGVLGGSVGLLSMQERVTLAGGQLEIRSRPGEGTTIAARMPLEGFA